MQNEMTISQAQANYDAALEGYKNWTVKQAELDAAREALTEAKRSASQPKPQSKGRSIEADVAEFSFWTLLQKLFWGGSH